MGRRVQGSPPVPPVRDVPVRLLVDEAHHSYLIEQQVMRARVSLWIATANLKAMMLEAPIGTRARASGRYVSALDRLAVLRTAGVEMRVLHASQPSRAFREALAKQPGLRDGGLQMRECPRVHMKVIVVDGRLLYLGSANFTGAGLGAKGRGRRNFEMGLVTEDDVLLDEVQGRYESIWTGKACGDCRIRGMCPGPLDGK